MTYLMWKRGRGFRIGTSQTHTNGQRRSVAGPAFRMNGEHADATWVIGLHPTEARARASETLLSLKYQLPKLPFVARPYQGHEGRSLVVDQGLIDQVFAGLDTEAAGRQLLREQGLSFEHPHFSAATTTSGRRVRRRLTVTLCGDSRGSRTLHRLSLFGYDDEGRRALEKTGLPIRSAYKGSTGWRIEAAHSDFSSLIETVERIEEAVEVSVRFTARLAARSGLPGKDSNSLPFMPASAVRPGMLMVNEKGEFDVVDGVDHVELEAPVYDIDVDQTHNFIANGLVTHNSIYAFRGADINNILDFERDFPGTRTIALEQNYRSTNSILDAANNVIANNRERKPKELWSELGDGEPVRVLEVEDEHAEARFVAAGIAGLVEEGFSGDEVAIFYRTNAQSRVLEDVLVRQGVAYQVIGGPRFYERAEIKDAIAYLQAIDNPYDAVSLQRIANRPRRGIGDSSLARLQTWADAQGRSLWEATEFAEEAGVGAAPLRAVQGFRNLMQSLQSGALEFPVSELLERTLERSGYLEALEAERTIEAQGRHENLQELVGVAREYQERAEEPSLSHFLQEISLYSDQDAIRGEESLVTLMTLHNAKGLEFRAVSRAREQLTLTHASSRSLWGSRGYNLPSRFLDELPNSIERERLRPASWSSYGAQGVAPRDDVPLLSTGDSVRHGTLGEGVVTQIEAGGVVTVRFADGSERRLMLDYAPLERIP